MRSRRQVYLCGMLLALWTPWSMADEPLAADVIAPGISAAQLRENLEDNMTPYIGMLLANPKTRKDYLQGYFALHALEQRAEKLTPAEQERVRVEAAVRRQQIIREAVIKHELDAIGHDIEALAKERYEAKKEAYQTRRRIKIAQIFIAKKPGQEEEAQKTMQGILQQLEADNLQRHQQAQAAEKAADKDKTQPSSAEKVENTDEKSAAETDKPLDKPEDSTDLFSDLAKQYSEDANAQLGGFDSRWLMQPEKELTDPVVNAAFELLRRGEVSEVIEGKYGYHILRLMDYVPNRQQDFDEVKDELMTAIRNALWADKDNALTVELQAPDDLPINDELALKVLEAVYATRDASLKEAAKPAAAETVEATPAAVEPEAASVAAPAAESVPPPETAAPKVE